MSRFIEEMLRNTAKSAEKGNAPENAKLSAEERGLLEACLAWKAGGPPLERDERVRPYLEQDPTHLRIVRALEQLLTAGRMAAAAHQATPPTRGR